jgi:adenine phosphoribosyltransferase
MIGEAQLQSKKEEARQQVLVPRETILMYNTYNYLKMNNKTLLENLRCIPDFPKKGINFRDVTTLYKSGECMKIMLDELYEIYKDKGITKIVGIESRGFVMASALAARLGCGMVMARKTGKLPFTTIKESFSKEYGVDTIEMHIDSIEPDDVVLIHDDLLATGGTAKAAYKLVKHFHPKKIMMNFIIEIRDEGLHGRDLFKGIELTTLLTI